MKYLIKKICIMVILKKGLKSWLSMERSFNKQHISKYLQKKEKIKTYLLLL